MTHFPFLQTLTQYPHRGAGTTHGREATTLIATELQKAGFAVELQPFQAPPTYIPIVYGLIGGLLLGLIAVPWCGWWAVAMTAFFAVNGLLYFDWWPSLCLYFPPWIKTHNVIGTPPNPSPTLPKLVLMAHYDTAPVSALYQKQTKSGFRNTLRISMVLMALTVPVTVGSVYAPESTILLILRSLLALYLVGQAFLGTVGFWQKGYTNGASDNATGVVAAIETAKNLKNALKNFSVEVVLTSSEEAGMIGAYHYWRQTQNQPNALYLINFDTLGAGNLKVITQTGSMTTMRYDNAVTQAAFGIIQQNTQLAHVTAGSWHTADFDSAWFVRAGVPCVTLAALDADGLMPRIHRPEDVLEAVDVKPMQDAITLATAIGKHLDALP
ncbi:MAG: M28 family metallopeptidase [Spirosomaceae bacterium]|nr:M28 family metallopeptidase [Spirosomataceae bacterium]